MKLFLFISLCVSLAVGKSVVPPKQEECTTEQHRPRFHFTPAQNWINDPNGMVYHDGTFHLFYQYHPFSTVWGPMHWGHATSTDLISWQELDVALAPDELGQIFSGSAVVDAGNSSGLQTNPDVAPIVAIFTHAGAQQVQSIAFSNDNTLSFTKYVNNPVLPNQGIADFRDPKVIYHSPTEKWIMSLAVWNKVEFYASSNLIDWERLSEFGGDPEEGSHGGVWECPDLFPLNVSLNGTEVELWILFVSINPGGPNRGSATQYFIGDFDGVTFTTFPWHASQWIDWGPDNYAGVTFSNAPDSRRIYMGWMNNWMYAEALPTASWRGQMTLPRQVGVYVLDQAQSEFRLTSSPVEELKALRVPDQFHENTTEFVLPPQAVVSLTEGASFTSTLLEVEVTLELVGEPRFSLCAHNSGGEEVCFGIENGAYYLDRSKSGNTGFNQEYAQTLHATATREVSETEVTVRMFLDVSSVEVFADHGLTALTSLYYSNQPLDMVYLNDWSEPGSEASIRVKNYKIWGLSCWFH